MTWGDKILNAARGSRDPAVRKKAQERLEAVRLYNAWLEKRKEESRQRRSA